MSSPSQGQPPAPTPVPTPNPPAPTPRRPPQAARGCGCLPTLIGVVLLAGGLVFGGAAVYFAALGVMGFRPRQFTRRAA